MEAIKISVVIPVYNSEECLLRLIQELTEALVVFNEYEIILVNDKSKDKSWEKIVQVCSTNNFVTGVNFRKNFGQDNAIMAGLQIARGEYIVIMDDDLQHSPSDIIKLYSKCREGFDICYGSFKKKKQKAWKNIGSWVNGKLSEKLLQKPANIYLSPFKVITKGIADEVLKYSGPFPYIDATLLTITSNITQTEVDHHPRHKGKGNFDLVKSTLVFIKHATNYSIYPLRMVSVLGFVIALLSFILGILYLVEYFFNSQRIEGWITIVILVIFFGGMILMSLGLIGEYIGRIFLSINKKPQFTIEQIIGNKKINN
ncbi:MAG TPA: glycosyltransferase family 2 protein [Bacteroidia bacterium]|jgi:glycosyltransferase involved in cell wall biosynthesis|nr:glycosyltransferase family 2 protein [Bacteroidia bacterium]